MLWGGSLALGLPLEGTGLLSWHLSVPGHWGLSKGGLGSNRLH